MNRRKNAVLLATGVLVGAAMVGPAAQAAVEALSATPSAQTFYVDGQKVELEAYAINGHNYVQLRDVGRAMDFDVSYDGTTNSVQIDSDAHYTEEGESGAATPKADGSVDLPGDGSQYVPKAGDVITCDDGSQYTITDVSRWDKSAFASGPVGALPEATCDWSSFPEVELPEVEARRYEIDGGDYLFLRNLYESRRMQHTIQNLAGNHPDTSENGKLKYGSKGTPSVRIQLTIDEEMSKQSFWPWRESELERLFNSCPPGTYCMEAWDVYKDGVFQRTEYNIYAL